MFLVLDISFKTYLGFSNFNNLSALSTYNYISNFSPVEKNCHNLGKRLTFKCGGNILVSVWASYIRMKMFPIPQPQPASSYLDHFFQNHAIHWPQKGLVKNVGEGASLAVQWLRIHLPMQGTWVQALVQEDPTCRRATKPMHHNYWACTLEPTSHNYWAHAPQLLKPACPCSATREATTMRSPHTATKSSPRSP